MQQISTEFPTPKGAVVVVRLEHPKTARGPYVFLHPDTSTGFTPCMEVGTGCMPVFRADMGRGYGVVPSVYKYGFTNAEQAQRWWDDTAKLSAARYGYKLAVYKVLAPAVIDDGNQCIFDPRVAKLVSHIDPQAWLHGDLNILVRAALSNEND